MFCFLVIFNSNTFDNFAQYQDIKNQIGLRNKVEHIMYTSPTF